MAENTVEKYKVVVIGGSAGSLEIIMDIVKALPPNPNAVVIIVIHRKSDYDSMLRDLLSHKTTLPVTDVEDKEGIRRNRIYIAPPDYHLLIENETTFCLDYSEKVHYSRPSIDVTFESVADVFGSMVIGILLSGSNADGAQGLCVIKEKGGQTIVQNPETAEVGFMPQQAINRGCADHIINREDIPSKILSLIEV